MESYLSAVVHVSQFTSQSFPLGDGRMLIAPYWADVDTTGTGTVWYRQTSDAVLLSRARREIRAVFVTHMNFEPTMLFIATWDHVGYYNSRTDLTNTFQCVMITDGRRSFVIFLYADGEIQWTTGDASGGTNGLGGTEAQVGFNAGDGIRFTSVPGSQTPAIINIDTTSNVGNPGVWIFQVDADEVPPTPGCTRGPGVTLDIGPRSGSQLGGTAVYVTGPCFNEVTNAIQCFFDSDQEISTPGVYVSNDLAICVSPPFDTPGWKPLTVRVNTDGSMDLSETGRFYAIPPESTDHVQLESDSVLLSSDNFENIQVRWEPESLFQTMDPSSYTVDISLYLLRDSESGNEIRKLHDFVENLPNSGNAFFPVPTSTDIELDENNVYEVSVRISISRPNRLGGTTEEAETSLIETLSGRVAQWTSTIYYAHGVNNIAARLGITLERRCIDWCRDQPEGIGETILNRLPPCPPRVDQARAPNSGFAEDLGYWTRQSNRFFHPEAATCFRQSTFTSSHMGSGQQCCYGQDDNLIVGPGSGGSVDLFAPNGIINKARHFYEDVRPFIYCCKGHRASSTCQMYYDKRPSDDGTRYNPPPPACVYGDPHIVTLDGFKYTFNGLGEFVLIETTNNSFQLQGRMVQAVDNRGNPISATVFSAIVGREQYSDTVQFQLTMNEDDIADVDVLMNGELVNFENLAEQQFNNVTVTKLERSASAVFASGVYVEVRAANGILSTLLVSLAESYRTHTMGLMGDFDGDTSNDLLPRGSITPIPLTSSLQNIHNLFGVTWIINNPEGSLFTYADEEGWSTFYQPNFSPAFEPVFSNPTLEEQANDICGNDPFCRFDIAATNRTDIGITTLQGNIEFETIVDISRPVICNPPCEFGVCVRNDTCSCADGYSGDTCGESIIDECDVNPCVNGGTCTLVATSAVCSCPDGYSGLFCEEVYVPPFEGSGSPSMCPCSRGIECSFAGQLQDSLLTSASNELKCTIITEPQAISRESIVIDTTFNTQHISPGSLSFLASIGVLSRDAGFMPCVINGDPLRPFLDVLGVEFLSVIYTNPDGSFGSLDIDRSILQEVPGGDFTLQVILDSVNLCSLLNLLEWMGTSQPTQVMSTCRYPPMDGGTTIAYFPVSCMYDAFS